MRKAVLFLSFCFFFLLLTSGSYAFTMRSGYYVGNGAARSITGIGIAPDLVIIKADTTAGEPVWRSSAMIGDTTAYTAAGTANFNNGITSLDTNGFSLGPRTEVNLVNTRYTWVAFGGSGGSDFKVGSYTGGAQADLFVNDVGFQPDLVWVKHSGTTAGALRPSSLTGTTSSLLFGATNLTANYITTLSAEGFHVGTSLTTNGNLFYYVAFKNSAGSMKVGSYVGNGTDDRSLSGLGFKPDFVLTKLATTAGTAQTAVLRGNQNYGDETQLFGATANALNVIQTLEADGFQIGSDARVNTNALSYHYAAFGGVPAPAAPTGSFTMTSGSYDGNGTGQAITGLGFSPHLVMIKDATEAEYTVFSTSQMSSGSFAYLAVATANVTTNGITLESNGFSVGNNTAVNKDTIKYRWVAFGNSGCADFQIGAYTGIGVAVGSTREVTGLGFTPDLVTIKANAATLGVWRNKAMSGDNTGFFSALAEAPNRIKTLSADLFQIGNDPQVNTAATINYYFAFKETANKSKFDQYSGTGGAQSVSGLGFSPQFVWVKNNGLNGGVWREGTYSGVNSQLFLNAAQAPQCLTSLEADGFTVGTDARVSASGTNNYRYAAWRSTATAAKLGFTVQPSNTSAEGIIVPAVKVAVQDQYGQTIVADGSAITLTLEANAGGATLEGTLTQTASAGIATFNNLKIKTTGVAYKIRATAAGLTLATSEAFNITPASAVKLRIGRQPATAEAGVSLTAMTVEVLDATGTNRVTSDNSTQITVTFEANPGSGTLSGTLTKTVSSGIATFENLSVDKVGSGYKFRFSAAGLTPATSDGFGITPSTANKLGFLVQPSETVAAATVAPPLIVAVQDQFGNLVPTDTGRTITISILNNPGGGTPSGTLSKTNTSGVATFENLSINKIGSGYTLLASPSGGLSTTTSNSFNIIPAAGSKLAYLSQPSSAGAGTAITPEVTIALQDASGNLVTADGVAITLAISNNPGSGTLSGTTTRTTVTGLATFEDLSINRSGTGYTLQGSSAGFTPATSDAFNITPSAAYKLGFTVQPVSKTVGSVITPEVKVAVQDYLGNTISSDNLTAVTLALGSNPGGSVLTGTATQTASAGLAAFPGLSLNKVGTGYTFVASATGLAVATSDAFNITPGPAISAVSPSKEAQNVAANAKVTISFDQVMDQAAVAAAFTLKAIMDNNGTSLDAISVSGTTTWDAAGKVFSFTPASLSKGYSYQAAVAATAANLDGITLASAESWRFTVIYDHGRENTTFSADRLASVKTGSGTLPNDGYILINRDPRNAPTVVDPAKITDAINKVAAEGDSHHYLLPATITEFNLYDSSGTRVATTFAEAATLALYFANDANKKNFVLHRLDEAHGLWIRVPGSAVNLVDNYVYAPVRSFSVYTVMAVPAVALTGVYAFPNPFQPSLGHTKVTFTNLASQCTIKVFTLSGDLVKTIEENSGTGQNNSWDVKNEAGEPLASGTYFYYVKSSGDIKTGKLVVIR
jgi:hypothetical protein